MEYRRVHSEDFEQIVALQNKNLVEILDQTEQKDGFLSAAFSVEEFQAMDEDLCVVVCVDAGQVCGYACASSVEYNQQFPLVAAMIERFQKIHYQAKPLTSYRSFIYGPVCIDKAYRGQGVLTGLFNQMQKLLRERESPPELLIVLISAQNERSLKAHQKLGIEMIDQFLFKDKLFWVLVRLITK